MRSIMAAVAVYFVASAAMAEGLLDRFPVYSEPPPASVGFSSFATGFYGGVTAGYSAATIQADDFDFGGNGLLGGGYVGFNYRLPGLVIGVEGDWMLTDIKAETDNALFTFTAKTNSLASVRARAGLPMGPVLVYGTGGIAWTDAEVVVPGGNDDKMLMGWVAGAGVEIELTRTVHIRLEGLHYGFDEETFTAGGGSGDVGLDQTVVRAGLGFRLD